MTKKQKIEIKDWTYLGEVKKGKPHGKGKRVWNSKIKSKPYAKYEGKFNDGKENGFGKLYIFEDEIPDYFEGNFKNGKFHGKGVYFTEFSNKKKYFEKHDGTWKNGKPIRGKIIEKNYVYDGEWKSTIGRDWGLPFKWGKGVITYSNGTKLVGTFYNDEFKIGNGLINFGDSIYVGQIKTIDYNFKPHGKGKDKFKDGTMLEGIFKNGRLHKATNYIFSTEDIRFIYQGELSKSGELLAQGKGIMKIFSKNKKIKFNIYEKGNFKNHVLDGNGLRIYYHDKKLTRVHSIYKGAFKNGQRHGDGLYWEFPNNFYHEGRFSEDSYIGKIKPKVVSKKVLDLTIFAYGIK